MNDNSGGGGSWGPEEKQAKDKYAQIRDVLSKYGFNPDDAFKPSTAGTGTVGAVYNPNTGGAIGTSGSLPGQFNQNANIRLGDYSQDAQGNWKVVTNSPTDLANKFVTSNATPLQGLSFGDYAKAAGRAITASFGVPSGDNVAETTGTGIAGGLFGNAATPGPLKAIWAIGNFADSLIDAQDAKIDAYLNQDFNYDLALDFYKDDNGDIRFKPNYKKMAEGGSESGEAVLASQNVNMIDVSMSDDNKMNINVSPVFAASDRYREALKFIKDTYGTLTKEQADEVVDKDTGKTRLQTIEDYLKSEQSNYLYNAQTIKDIKEKAPNASEKSLNIAVDTSKIGYLNEDQLSKVKVSIYNKNNQLEEVNAKAYLDSIKNMSKVERNDYMLSLGNRMNDPSISDNEKAVLYAQSRALYAASDLDGGYKGMYQRDFLDEIGSMPEAFTGMTWNTLFDGTDLETFRQDEFSSGLYSLASTGASIVTLSKATNLIESGIRKVPGLSKLSKAVGDTSRQAVASTLSAAEKTGESAALTLAKIAGKTAGQLGFQVAADALYDAAKIIPYALKDNMDEYDFLKELGNDFVMDMLITYGPRSFAGSMNANATKTEYRVAYENTKTGDIQYFRPKDVKPDSNYKMLEGPDGTRDSKLVDVTSEELATRHAKAIDSLTDSNAALKVQELIFDKNAAMSKLAVQVRSVSDRYHYHKMLRYAADARQITEDTLATFLGKNNVSQHWETMRNTFKEVAPKVKDLSKADQNYIKAVVNEARFLGKNAGDKKAETVIKNFYKSAKSGVDASRAEELNTLIKAMQDVAADVLDFYVEKGLMKEKDVKELRSQPGYEDGYLPMYMSTDVKSSTGGDVSQDRALYKKVRDAKALISLDDLDNPLNSLARYINNAMRAVAMNDRALAIREAASMAGVGIHLVEDSGGAMKDIVNLKEFDAGFKSIYKDIAIKTKKSLPSQKEWQETNDKMVLRSNALKAAQKVQELQDEIKQLQNENRGIHRRIKKLEAEGHPRKNRAQIEELFGRLNANRTLIADNKQQQLMFVDDIKRYTGNLMERAQKAHKGSDAKLDIKLYLDVQVTNSLKQSIKSDNMVGQVQGVLNRAVQAANPWVDPQVVIERRAHAAAIRYRNKVAKDLKEETKKNKKEGINSDRINAAVDRAMDKVLEKITGERKAEVTFIDDEGNATTKMLDNYEDSHTIRYMLNGKEQRMVLDGQGSEELVAEFYAPEFTTPKTALGKVMNKITRKGNEVAQIKRYLTTSADISRVIPNIMRDWSRGIVSTSGQIVLSPEKYFAELSEQYGYTPEQVKIINNGLMLAREAIDKSTLTSSLQMPNKNRDKSMVRAMTAPDGNGFVRYLYDLKTGGVGKVFSALQDLGETFTRKRAMDIAYYQELARAQGEGKDLDVAIKRAVEAAYFSGRESTVNFRRRGVLIGKIAQSVPYLTQRFATLQSFTYSYLNDPVGVTNALKTTVSAYTSLVAIALSNEESRKKYFMLNEYDRANNIIIPIDNGLIITLPLDDTIAAFLTPYRRMVESMNGLDPQAFYLCFAEGLAALSPADLSGFSEGDGFNVARGFEKLGAEFIPTWAQPFVEAYTGKDLYYGSSLSVNNDYTGSVYGTWNPTPGQMTTQSRNSKTLATISDNTGIPQWILQNFLSEYGGNIGQYVLNTVDKIGGATEAQQGGKEWMDSVFKPFTGLDSDSASNAFYDLVNGLKEEKTKVQNEIKTLTQRANNAGGEEKAELLDQRQKKIEQYGLHVTDAIENYLSAFEITGGLSKKQANQVWYLYKLYDEDSNDKLYLDNTTGDYYTDKARAWNNKQATSLAAGSGIDAVVRQPVSDYYDSYAEQAFKQTSYGDTYHYIAEIEDIMNDNNINRSEMFKNYDKMTSAQKKQWKAAWNTKVVKALAPYIQKTGIDNVLDQRKIVDYLDEVIFVSNPWNTKQYLKKIFGGK